MNVLLDTCAFIWLAMPQGKLSAAAIEIINDPTNDFYVSDVTLWEVTLKHSTGKLPLPDVPRVWIPRTFAHHQFKSLSLDQASIFRSGELPRIHADPFDRLLAAQAIEAGMTLLSPDAPLSLLGASRVW